MLDGPVLCYAVLLFHCLGPVLYFPSLSYVFFRGVVVFVGFLLFCFFLSFWCLLLLSVVVPRPPFFQKKKKPLKNKKK